MQAIKCVVVGDGAVGKILLQFYTICSLYYPRCYRFMLKVKSNRSKPTTFIFRKNMSAYQLHNKCLSRRIHPNSFRQLLSKCDGGRKAD